MKTYINKRGYVLLKEHFPESVINKLKHVIKLCKKRNISIGTIATSIENMDFLLQLGVNFIVYMVDMNVLCNSYMEINKSFKKFLNK